MRLKILQRFGRKVVARTYSARTTAFFLVAALIWIAIPATIFWLLSNKISEATFAKSVGTWAAVEKASGTVQRPIGIAIQWTPEANAFAPPWSGVTQEVHVKVGETLANRQTVVAIAGLKRLAMISESPLYRNLEIGDSGPDVQQLNDFLEVPANASMNRERITPATLREIRKFAAEIGVKSPEVVDFFDRSWVIFVPQNSLTVKSMNLAVGAPAPSEGTAILEFEPRIMSASLIDPLEVERLQRGATQQNSGGESEPTNESLASDVETDIATSKVQLEEGVKLLIANTPIEVSLPGRNRIAEKGLSSLENLVEDRPAAIRGVTESENTAQWTVPAAAIITDNSGQRCVFVRVVEDESTVSKRVDVVGSARGKAEINADLEAAMEVWIPNGSAVGECA